MTPLSCFASNRWSSEPVGKTPGFRKCFDSLAAMRAPASISVANEDGRSLTLAEQYHDRAMKHVFARGGKCFTIDAVTVEHVSAYEAWERYFSARGVPFMAFQCHAKRPISVPTKFPQEFDASWAAFVQRGAA